MRELAVVLVVALAVAAAVLIASRLRAGSSASDHTRAPAALPGPTHDDVQRPSAGAPEPHRTDAPAARTAAASTASPADDDAEAVAAVAVIDVLDRIVGGRITREQGLALVEQIGAGLPRGLHRGGPPLTLPDVLGEVLRSLAEVVDLARIDDPDVIASVALARADDRTARAGLAAAGTERLLDGAATLFAAWAGGPGDEGPGA